MENLENLSLIQLNKYGAELKDDHEKCKNEIIKYSDEISDIETKINKLLSKLSDIEDEYINLIKEVQNR